MPLIHSHTPTLTHTPHLDSGLRIFPGGCDQRLLLVSVSTLFLSLNLLYPSHISPSLSTFSLSVYLSVSLLLCSVFIGLSNLSFSLILFHLYFTVLLLSLLCHFFSLFAVFSSLCLLLSVLSFSLLVLVLSFSALLFALSLVSVSSLLSSFLFLYHCLWTLSFLLCCLLYLRCIFLSPLFPYLLNSLSLCSELWGRQSCTLCIRAFWTVSASASL